jgi:hypothetical protein
MIRPKRRAPIPLPNPLGFQATDQVSRRPGQRYPEKLVSMIQKLSGYMVAANPDGIIPDKVLGHENLH